MGMMKQAKKLTAFIKPSSPNPLTTQKLACNTEDWLFTNLQILHQHYDGVLAELIHTLLTFDQVAMEKAIVFGKA